MLNFSSPPVEVVKAMKSFYTGFTSVGLVCGLLGSALCVLIVLRDFKLRASTRLFQGLLGLSDAAVLLTSGLRYCLIAAFSFDVRENNAASCRWHTLLTYAVNDVATWSLCALTTERFVLVTWPTLGHRSCPRRTLRTALVICGLLCSLAVLKNFVIMWRKWDSDIATALFFCSHRFYQLFDRTIFSSFDFALTLTIPNCLVVISCLGILRILGRNRLPSPQEPAAIIDDVQQQALRATRMMLGIGVVFLFTNLPSFVYLILSSVPNSVVSQYEEQVVDNLYYEGIMILQLTGNMSRFYVCIISSKYFRNQLRQMFSSRVLPQNAGEVSTRQTT